MLCAGLVSCLSFPNCIWERNWQQSLALRSSGLMAIRRNRPCHLRSAASRKKSTCEAELRGYVRSQISFGNAIVDGLKPILRPATLLCVGLVSWDQGFNAARISRRSSSFLFATFSFCPLVESVENFRGLSHSCRRALWHDRPEGGGERVSRRLVASLFGRSTPPSGHVVHQTKTGHYPGLTPHRARMVMVATKTLGARP